MSLTQRPSSSPFDVPTPYSRSAGTEASSTVAAPLLAGGALALIGVVVQQEDALRYPGMVLIFLLMAVLSLVISVQCGAQARQYSVMPEELAQWWPDANDARKKIMIREQQRHAWRQRLWTRRLAASFNVGILLLWISVGLSVAPKHGDQQPGWRWAAVGVAGLGAVVEITWTAIGFLGQRWDWASRLLHGAGPQAPPPPA